MRKVVPLLIISFCCFWLVPQTLTAATARQDTEIGSIKSILEKLDAAEYSYLHFWNFQYVAELEEWQQTLCYPRNMRSTSDQLFLIRDHLLWMIRADMDYFSLNKDFERAYGRSYPEPGTEEYVKLIKSKGGQYGRRTEFAYIIGVDDPDAALRLLLDKGLIVETEGVVQGAKVYQWVKSPFDNFVEHTAQLALIPATNELVMSTAHAHLVGVIEARMGMRPLASDYSDRWQEFEPLEKYIEPKSGWSLSIGQDIEKELDRQQNLFAFSKEEMEKRRNRIRGMTPLGEVFINMPMDKGFLIRSISTWDLNSQEIRDKAAALKSQTYDAFTHWAKDTKALDGTVTVKSDGNSIIVDTFLSSECVAWAYGSKGFEHLDEKAKQKQK